jgi:hypothetical protein
MKLRIAAALALTAASSLDAQTTPAPAAIDFSTATPLDGSWSYSATAIGSEATFTNASAQPQLTVTCSRPTRQVTIAKSATAAAPFMSIWTSAETRSLPASFNPATARISVVLSAFDPLLDAIAFSRGRAAFTVSGQPPLIVPSWPEPARVVEDCRV